MNKRRLIKDLSELRMFSISVESASQSIWVGNRRFDWVDAIINRSYLCKDEVVIFTVHGRTYATPFSESAIKILNEEGFKYLQSKNIKRMEGAIEQIRQRELSGRRWKTLAREAVFIRRENYADEMGFEPMSDVIMNNCYRIPDEGIQITNGMNLYTYKPWIPDGYFGPMVSMIGKFNTLGDMVVFIYRDGYTYLTNAEVNRMDVIEELLKSGFIQAPINVPLSRVGEVIVDDEAEKFLRKVI